MADEKEKKVSVTLEDCRDSAIGGFKVKTMKNTVEYKVGEVLSVESVRMLCLDENVNVTVK